MPDELNIVEKVEQLLRVRYNKTTRQAKRIIRGTALTGGLLVGGLAFTIYNNISLQKELSQAQDNTVQFQEGYKVGFLKGEHQGKLQATENSAVFANAKEQRTIGYDQAKKLYEHRLDSIGERILLLTDSLQRLHDASQNYASLQKQYASLQTKNRTTERRLDNALEEMVALQEYNDKASAEIDSLEKEKVALRVANIEMGVYLNQRDKQELTFFPNENNTRVLLSFNNQTNDVLNILKSKQNALTNTFTYQDQKYTLTLMLTKK